ncbi:MAG: hypothetical protein P4L81_06215 [Candidatus Pacebacteria bacterium]|nr:hypothetical protein [Candidatus Paceibacterota bacterium]
MIKAIETSYKGYRFRSRLEARWAVFFETLGVEWKYEPEGFELSDGTRYLPDFWLPGGSYGDTSYDPPYCNSGFFVEIKPVAPTIIERNKMRLLIADMSPIDGPQTSDWGMILAGDPMDHKEYLFQPQWRERQEFVCTISQEPPTEWLTADGQIYREPSWGMWDSILMERLRVVRMWHSAYDAAVAARSARFEFDQ